MTKIRITQVKSGIDRPERQKLTLRALGLNKLNASREVEATAQILGMIRKVNHLIKIEETSGANEPAGQQAELSSQVLVTEPAGSSVPNDSLAHANEEVVFSTETAKPEDPATGVI
jgi:large subunit ribosomal protein L30